MVLVYDPNAIGQGFDTSLGIPMAVPCKELGKRVVGRCEVRIHDGPNELHTDLLLAECFEAINIDVVKVHIGNRLALVFNATGYCIAF